jgi:hypothetical protein
MMDNGHINKFLQFGQQNGHGYLRFTSKENKTIAKIKMRRQKDGLWYTGSPVLQPPQCQHPSNGTPPYPDKHPHINKPKVDNNFQSQKADNTNTTTPLLRTTQGRLKLRKRSNIWNYVINEWDIRHLAPSNAHPMWYRVSHNSPATTASFTFPFVMGPNYKNPVATKSLPGMHFSPVPPSTWILDSFGDPRQLSTTKVPQRQLKFKQLNYHMMDIWHT